MSNNAKEVLYQLVNTLENYVGASFPGELTRQGKDVPIVGFSALCIQTNDYMELKWGKDWQTRAFSECPVEEQWDRVQNSSIHNFLWRLQQVVAEAKTVLEEP